MDRVVLPSVLLSLLLYGMSSSALANPQDYPQFAQRKVDRDITIAFITPEEVKYRLDTGTQQIIVDVRQRARYENTHLPGAVSIPLQTLPERYVEIPRDIPIVLY